MSSVPKVCWDADVLITILKGQDPDRTPEELAALKEAVLAFDTGRLTVVVPTTIYGEVLEPIGSEELTERFEGVLRRSNVVLQDITAEVSLLAGRLRKAVGQTGRKLKTPDSQYIATALTHGCDELHTFDAGLLRLSGEDAVRGLRITKPGVEQAELDLG